jgi:hypothetical protein
MKPLGLLRICDCYDCGGRQADKAAAREEEKRMIEKELAETIGVPCPNCPDRGWYTKYNEDAPYQEQCEFCYNVPNSIFNLTYKGDK